MSEEKKEIVNEQEDPIIRIPVTRHEWPDEKERKALKKKNSHLRIALVIVSVLTFCLGVVLGTLRPLIGSHLVNDGWNAVTKMDANEKFQSVLEMMTNNWFFADQIDEVEKTLTDEALYGMTDNEIDPHTSYMSKEEVESFTQGINRNFVGIGVMFSTNEGIFMIEEVFKNSPAESAGVMVGDIISAVNGTSVEGLTSQDVVDLVKGDAGTTVHIDFERNGEIVGLDMNRAEVANIATGKNLTDDIGYIKLNQFGDTSGNVTRQYLDDFTANGTKSLVIDLRGDGGGYLDALREVASLFLPADSVAMKQVYSDGTEEIIRTVEAGSYSFSPIVILMDENTASAAEVFVLAMKENRDDVITVGTTTYGKGTVQITRRFTDGSALKFTTSKWVSSQDVWVNDVGITPDEEVKLHEALYTSYPAMNEAESYAYDSVSSYVKGAQLGLDYLEYTVDRTDGYFSKDTEAVLQQFQADRNMEVTGILDQKTYNALISAMAYDYSKNPLHDTQLQKALSILEGE